MPETSGAWPGGPSPSPDAGCTATANLRRPCWNTVDRHRRGEIGTGKGSRQLDERLPRECRQTDCFKPRKRTQVGGRFRFGGRLSSRTCGAIAQVAVEHCLGRQVHLLLSGPAEFEKAGNGVSPTDRALIERIRSGAPGPQGQRVRLAQGSPDFDRWTSPGRARRRRAATGRTGCRRAPLAPLRRMR